MGQEITTISYLYEGLYAVGTINSQIHLINWVGTPTVQRSFGFWETDHVREILPLQGFDPVNYPYLVIMFETPEDDTKCFTNIWDI